MSVAVVGISVAADPEPWASIGLQIDDDATWIGGIRLGFVDGASMQGVTGWTLAGSVEQADTIDGLATSHVDSATMASESWDHPLGVRSFDHLVVMTSSLERTCGAVAATTGAELRRVRDAGAVRQGFHRMGPIILEVVESERVTQERSSFWGFVLIVDDLDAAVRRLGPERIGPARDAVQPGRRIASFRAAAGLGVPVALMTG
ncbi:MAG: hypothetical protein RI958_3098 [Actinomycetota bacterium]